MIKVTEVNSEENLVQVEGVVVPTNTAVESGDAMIMEAGELKEAGGNQLQMVTSGSNSKDSMRSGGKVTTENDQGGPWTPVKTRSRTQLKGEGSHPKQHG
ncbi:hypothetical protein RIF29_20314 [Crotalaria pallida]|uniref:Uncharacterized protein n=1 Tax=Crotalaria pallida TaxID=3830 RepID=A0AAN9F2B0_CROPI